MMMMVIMMTIMMMIMMMMMLTMMKMQVSAGTMNSSTDDSDINEESSDKNDVTEKELLSNIQSFLAKDFNLRSNSMYSYELLEMKQTNKKIINDGMSIHFMLTFAQTGCRKNGALKEQLKCPTGVLMDKNKPTKTEIVKVIVNIPEKVLHNFEERHLTVIYS
ncbi:uncharacterized protein LOC105847680 isoform X2 [Hydra vulgaris]|uniref:Uncharacterized protein LOC105847680 isoform X2 n=1 Tax=Hydra vulgaris TaxID=6087 RepID=A0ABM4CYQ6_HYDVU